MQEKRFHNWLEGARDWAVSRTRFWGTPLPLWISQDGEEIIVMDSVDKLEKLSGVKVNYLCYESFFPFAGQLTPVHYNFNLRVVLFFFSYFLSSKIYIALETNLF